MHKACVFGGDHRVDVDLGQFFIGDKVGPGGNGLVQRFNGNALDGAFVELAAFQGKIAADRDQGQQQQQQEREQQLLEKTEKGSHDLAPFRGEWEKSNDSIIPDLQGICKVQRFFSIKQKVCRFVTGA